MPDTTPTPLDAAIAEHQADRFAQAETLYRQVLASQKDNVDALRLLGVLRAQRGDIVEAERLLQQAVTLGPNHAKAHDNLAFFLARLGRGDEALAAARRAVEIAPHEEAFQFNLGTVLIGLKRKDEGVDALRQTIKLNPRHGLAHQQLGTTLLELGDAQGALHHLDALVELGLASSGVHAHRGVALSELGDSAALQELVDLDGLIRPAHIGDGHGFTSLADFNAALAAHVATNKTLHEERTTVHGLDTGELFESSEPCVVALKAFVERQIEARLASLPPAPHPFAALAPQRRRIMSWGVKMWRQGYQVSHIHQHAWLSGVYYVQMPDAVRAGTPDRQGWIEFGRGPAHLYRKSQPPLRLIQPVEGMMLTFPSYIWHRTIPFDGPRERISIAFDVVAVT